MKSQNQIIQEIVDMVIDVIDERWKEVIINYQVEEVRSRTIKTFLYERDGSDFEKSVPFIAEIDSSFRELREHLSQSGEKMFAKCLLHIKSDGVFNADYSYEKPSWDIQSDGSGWNFETKNKG